MAQTDCNHKGCSAKALSFADACCFHLEDKQAYLNIFLKKAADRTSFQDGNFSYVDFSGLELKDLDFRGANLSHANLSNATFWHADFENANLTGVNLSFADISSANFKNAQLFKANLTFARCWNTDFTSANLAESDLSSSDLLNAKLFDSRLWHANIDNVKSLNQQNFKSAVSKFIVPCRIYEKRLKEAKETYTALKKYFLDSGKYLDVHWVSFQEMTMERLELLHNKDPRYLPSLLMGLSCGYGEKPFYVILNSIFVILAYAWIYFQLDVIIPSATIAFRANFWDSLYFSIVTFTAVGYGDFLPRSYYLFRLLACSEAFLGVFTMGLFVFTLARRYSAR